MTLGEAESLLISCPDEEVIALEDDCGTLEHKYDQILSRVLKFISGFDSKGK